MTKITIATVDGPREVEATVVGQLAYHRLTDVPEPSSVFGITHLGTGFRLPNKFYDIDSACRATEELNRRVDFDGFVERLAKKKASVSEIMAVRDICERHGGEYRPDIKPGDQKRFEQTHLDAYVESRK